MTIPRTTFRASAHHRFGFLGGCLVSLFLFSCSAEPPQAKTAACASLSAPLPAPVSDAAGRVVSEPADPIAFIYDQSVLRTFELKLDDKDLALLDASPAAEKYVAGKLIFDGKEYTPVGIRYKGSVGSWIFCVANSTEKSPLDISGAKTCPKLSMKISFNEYDANGNFFGVKKLLFHAMNSDPSLMKERLGYWLYRQMGVPAPRAVHVRLLINGKYQGVFLNVEEVDSRFTRSHFADGQGNLYKELWPTAVDGLTAPLTTERIKAALETNKDKSPSFDKLLNFGQSVMQEDGAARAQALVTGMSISNSLRFIAVDRTIRADDGPFHFYCQDGGCGNHNVFLYEEQNAARFWLIPWDLDNSFVAPGKPLDGTDSFLQVIHDWNDHSAVCEIVPPTETYGLGQLPPSCDPLWNGLGCYFKDDYHAALADLLAGPFSESGVADKLDTWQAQIAAAVTEANSTDARQLPPPLWRDSLTRLVERTKELRAHAAGQL